MLMLLVQKLLKLQVPEKHHQQPFRQWLQCLLFPWMFWWDVNSPVEGVTSIMTRVLFLECSLWSIVMIKACFTPTRFHLGRCRAQSTTSETWQNLDLVCLPEIDMRSTMTLWLLCSTVQRCVIFSWVLSLSSWVEPRAGVDTWYLILDTTWYL